MKAYLMTLTALLLAVGVACGQSTDFESGYPPATGWYLAQGEPQMSTEQNHTPGGTTSVRLLGSASVTTAPIVDGKVSFWFYVDSSQDTTYDGYYTALEFFVKDDNNQICGQTWFRPYGFREHEAGAYIPVLPDSADITTVDGWNHVIVDYNYNTGRYVLTVNDTYTWTAPNFGIPDDRLGTGIISYTWVIQNANGVDKLYIDDVTVAEEPSDCASVHTQGYTLDADIDEDCYVGPTDLNALATEWLACNNPSDPECEGYTEDPWIAALPGYFVMGTKVLDDTDTHWSRLGMTTFAGDGTVTTKYWQWDYLVSYEPGHDALSDRLIGDEAGAVPGVDEPTNNQDENKYMKGLASQLGPETNLTTLAGTWTQDNRRIDIVYGDGSWEKWYITWEEPGNLYKMEMYDASYLKADTNCWLTSELTENTRDPNANSAGWAFGGATADFTVGAPVTAMKKDLIGCAMGYGASGPKEDVVTGSSEAGFDSSFNWTDNDVLRMVHEGNANLWVYAYLTTPINNPGILARRALYHITHDFTEDGHIENDYGHLYAGMQVIDAAGNYRGVVVTQYKPSFAVQTRFWLDTAGTADSAPSRTGVAGGSVFTENFDEIPGGERPTGGWYFSNASSGYVSNEQSVSPANSLKQQETTMARSVQQGDGELMQVTAGRMSFSVYLVENAEGRARLDYHQISDSSEYAINVWMGSAYINDYSSGGAHTYPGTLSLNEWHEIEVDFDHGLGATGEFTLYIDGENKGTRPMGASSPTVTYQWANNTEGTKYYDDIMVSLSSIATCGDLVIKGLTYDGDIAPDCYVNLGDLGVMSADWMLCNDPNVPGCIETW